MEGPFSYNLRIINSYKQIYINNLCECFKTNDFIKCTFNLLKASKDLMLELSGYISHLINIYFVLILHLILTVLKIINQQFCMYAWSWVQKLILSTTFQLWNSFRHTRTTGCHLYFGTLIFDCINGYNLWIQPVAKTILTSLLRVQSVFKVVV